MASDAEKLAAGQEFLWPPRTGEGDDAGVVAAPARATAKPAWFSRLALRVERDLLGVTTSPLDSRLHDAGWAADSNDSYCPRCGTSCGPFEADLDGCPICRRKRLRWNRAIRLGAYEGELRQAVLDAKFSAMRAVGRGLGRLLGKTIVQRMAAGGLGGEAAVLVPVPTSRRRRLSRGIDHTLQLAIGAGRATGFPVSRAMWCRHMRPQTAVSASGRQANVRGRYHCKARAAGALGRACRDARPAAVVMIDDVRTTGATLTAACRELRRAVDDAWPTGSRAGRVPIWVATVAVTPEPGRRSARGNTAKIADNAGDSGVAACAGDEKAT